MATDGSTTRPHTSQLEWGPLERSAVKAAAHMLPVALRLKASETNAGCETFLHGRIAAALGGDSAVGSEKDHAAVALLPRVLRTLVAAIERGEREVEGLDPSLQELLTALLDDPKRIPLSKATMLPLFPHAAKLALANYGSFGGSPLPVMVCQSAYQQHVIDGDSNRALLRQLFGMLEDVHRVLASYMGLPTSDNIVLVDNAGDGFNVVAESVVFNPAYYASVKGRGSTDPFRIMVMSNTYPMVKNCIQFWINRHKQLRDALPEGVPLWDYEVLTCPLTEPMIQSVNDAGEHDEPEALIESIVACAVENHADVVIIDHIAFAPALIMPIDAISRRIKAALPRCFIVVDAAHAIGAIPLDFGGGAERPPAFDAWFSNCHKWLMAPKQSAVLWFSDAAADYMHPTIKSNLYRGTPFGTSVELRQKARENLVAMANGIAFPAEAAAAQRRAEFYWRGTRDHSASLVLPDLIWLRRQLGEDRIVAHNRALALAAGEAVARAWGTELLITNPRFLPPMVSVRMPSDDARLNTAAGSRLIDALGGQFPTFTLFGRCYARIAGQIFSDVRDFEVTAERFLHALETCKAELPPASPLPAASPTSP